MNSFIHSFIVAALTQTLQLASVDLSLSLRCPSVLEHINTERFQNKTNFSDTDFLSAGWFSEN